MRHRRSLIALGLALAWACSDDDENTPPPGTPDTGGSAGDSAGSSGSSGAAGSSRGGASGDAGAGGDAGSPGGEGGAANGGTGNGGTAGEAGGGSTGGGGTSGTAGSAGSAGFPQCPSDAETEPPTFTSLCEIEGTWGPTVNVPLMDGAAQLLAVTPDELTISWFGVANMATTFYVADRSTPSEDFGAGQELDVLDYVALSPDGLRLVLVADGRLQERVRSARGQPFGAATEGSFATLDANAEQNDLMLLGGVISPDDRSFYYLVTDGTDDQPLHVSTRSGTGSWPLGTRIEACEFQIQSGGLRQPTGVSADGRTLFYVNYVRGQTRAAWRSTPTGPFVWFEDLGTRDRAQPNAACSRLYFTASGGPAYAPAQ